MNDDPDKEEFIFLDDSTLNGKSKKDELTPSEISSSEAIQQTLDELFHLARKYRSSESYRKLINFISQFRFYSPYNAMLIHIQMEGARFVAPAHRWIKSYGRIVKPNAQPLVILRPMGPIMFVFDVSDTEPGPNAKPLPSEVVKPFEVRSGRLTNQLELTIENAKRDGVQILFQKQGSLSAGSICNNYNKSLSIQIGIDKDGRPINIPVRYTLILNENLHSKEATYATIVHELAHLYCGHLGTPNRNWWPDRRGLRKDVREFEAESVTYLICKRLGIDNPSEQYLANYFNQNQEVPPISLECIMKAAGLIEKMGRMRLKLRKDKEE